MLGLNEHKENFGAHVMFALESRTGDVAKSIDPFVSSSVGQHL